jgi:hypothetical protein
MQPRRRRPDREARLDWEASSYSAARRTAPVGPVYQAIYGPKGFSDLRLHVYADLVRLVLAVIGILIAANIRKRRAAIPCAWHPDGKT